MDRSIFADTLRTVNSIRTPGMQRIREYFSLGLVRSPEQDVEDPDDAEAAANIAESLQGIFFYSTNN